MTDEDEVEALANEMLEMVDHYPQLATMMLRVLELTNASLRDSKRLAALCREHGIDPYPPKVDGKGES